MQRYIKGATEELEISTTLLKTVIRRLQLQLEEYRLSEIERERKTLQPKSYRMSQEEERRAGEFLTSQDLVKNTMKAIEKPGLPGKSKTVCFFFSFT